MEKKMYEEMNKKKIKKKNKSLSIYLAQQERPNGKKKANKKELNQ